jgi:hypothetical protein
MKTTWTISEVAADIGVPLGHERYLSVTNQIVTWRSGGKQARTNRPNATTLKPKLRRGRHWTHRKSKGEPVLFTFEGLNEIRRLKGLPPRERTREEMDDEQ